jgi:hypothetical protein
MKALLLTFVALLPFSVPAQMSGHGGMAMDKAAKPSTDLTITGLSGKTKTLTPADFKALPHVEVKVHNTHNNQDETYSGVPVKELLALVVPAEGEGAKVSPNVQIVVAGATDNFHVALTLCDTNPDCRSGQAIVADALDGKPLEKDGAFKLVLTEDKRPARWARNLMSLQVESAMAALPARN